MGFGYLYKNNNQGFEIYLCSFLENNPISIWVEDNCGSVAITYLPASEIRRLITELLKMEKELVRKGLLNPEGE